MLTSPAKQVLGCRLYAWCTNMAPADLTELIIAPMHSLYNTIIRRVGISVRVRGWAAATKPDDSKRPKSGVQ